MNFKLIDIQGYLNKKREIKLLAKPTLEKAFHNGEKDKNIFMDSANFTYYERILRNTFQLQVNNNYEKYQKSFTHNQNKQDKIKILQKATQSEKEIYENYLEHVKQYKRGLSRKSDTYNGVKANKKTRKVKTEIVFCFDASFGMYHISLFQAVGKFIDLLNFIDSTEVDVAIVAYGSGVHTVSTLSSSKVKLLLSTSMILPVGGVTVLFDNYKLATVSDNDLFLALHKANNLFYNSKNAVREINRHIVVLSDGNISGIVGADLESYEIDKSTIENENLQKILEVKKTLDSNKIILSSIALKGDNSNIIKEFSEKIFWEDNVKRINANVGMSIGQTQSEKLIDIKEYETRLRDIMKLNLKYIQQKQYKGKVDV
jgi:Mg-chelatase subunit ChlD